MRTPRLRGHRPLYQSGGRRQAKGLDGRGRNPLERPSDRIERRLRVLLMAVLVLAVPMAAWVAGSAAHDHDSRLRQVQMAQRHPVTARLLSDANGDGQAGAHASVRWSDSRGAHFAIAAVGPWQRAGDTATLWLDAHGNVTAPPPASDMATLAGAEMGFAAAAGVVLTAGGAWKVVRVCLDRRRLRQWDREWELVEPRWTGRRGR